LVQKIIEAYK